MSRVGQVDIFNQPANGKLEKFQSTTNPQIYESSGSIKNINGFNTMGWASWKIQQTNWNFFNYIGQYFAPSNNKRKEKSQFLLKIISEKKNILESEIRLAHKVRIIIKSYS